MYGQARHRGAVVIINRKDAKGAKRVKDNSGHETRYYSHPNPLCVLRAFAVKRFFYELAR